MSDIRLGIYPLSYEEVTDPYFLRSVVYPDMRRNYYWSKDFSADFYIAQAKAGFIAVTDRFEGEELLIPEMQFSYMLLDFQHLHISRKVRRIISKRSPQLIVTENIDPIIERIRRYHRSCWLTPRYRDTLLDTKGVENDFRVVAAYVEEDEKIVSGEIGYIIADTYTSLSGFSSKEKEYAGYGTLQLVLLARYLEENGFAFWNLGQSYMPYKFALGARKYDRFAFLKRWLPHIYP